MKRVLLLVAVAGLLATPAMADVQKTYDVGTSALIGPDAGGSRVLPQTFGFEVGEGFAVGPIGGQAGWTMFAASTVEGHVDTVNPFAGEQHLRIAYDPAGTGGLVGGFSPAEGALTPGAYTLSVEVAISTDGQSDFDIVPQAPSQGFLSARVKFSWLGDIQVLDDIGAGLAFVSTGVNYNIGPYTNLTIDMDAGANTMDYYYGGSLIYSSVAGVYAGTTFEQAVFLSDNYAVSNADFDNMVMTPEPASLALLGLGALMLIRRR